MTSFGERVRKSREEKGITLKQIERDTGISNSNLSRIERQLNAPSIDIAVTLAEYLDESLDYLARGVCKYADLQLKFEPDLQRLIEAYNILDNDSRQLLKADVAFLLSRKHSDILEEALSKVRAPAPDSDPESNTVKEERSVYLPILGTAAAGMPIMTDELLEGFLPVPAAKIKKNTYLIRVSGDSMIEADIHDGDLVIINPQPNVENGEIALARVDGEVTIKKFYRDDFSIRLKPANSTMGDIVVRDLSKIKILGRVIGSIPSEEVRQNMLQEFDGPKE